MREGLALTSDPHGSLVNTIDRKPHEPEETRRNKTDILTDPSQTSTNILREQAGGGS